jgi:hypothetical protein
MQSRSCASGKSSARENPESTVESGGFSLPTSRRRGWWVISRVLPSPLHRRLVESQLILILILILILTETKQLLLYYCATRSSIRPGEIQHMYYVHTANFNV